MRAQVDVISITLIAILAIALAGTAYVWLKPLVEKRWDISKVERLLADFNPETTDSLPRKIVDEVVKGRSEVSFEISGDGIWLLSPPHTIQFFTFSRVSNVAADKGWISLTRGVTCPTPQPGVVGEVPYAACIRVDSHADGFNLTYRVTFRELLDPQGKVYDIHLKKWAETSKLTSSQRILRMSFGGTSEKDGRMITEVRILLL